MLNTAPVALRKESVDRNFGPLALSGPRAQSLSARRAWIEMAMWVYWLCCGRSSLSARRAWIEILAAGRKAVEKGSLSARRAWIEILHIEYCVICIRSLSARRAWIEIEFKASSLCSAAVALRKESVDRNASVLECLTGNQ